ncbi:MAG: PKD domain-containing protein [Saprospiraceae bacterium]
MRHGLDGQSDELTWTFGGTPSTSTQQNPTVTFNQDGTVTVTLVVSNGVCSDNDAGCTDQYPGR